jgi:hypothetical protein
MNCVQWFRKAYPGVLAFHVPNGEWRHQHTADTLQRMGVFPGVADWLVFKDDLRFAIELKSGTGQSANQADFATRWTDEGGIYAIVEDQQGFEMACMEYLGAPQPMQSAEPPPIAEEAADVALPVPPKMPWET